MDIRTERTLKLLCDALEELLDEKPFDAITVVEICERSTVRRATFYRHFEEKYAFFDYYLKSLTSRFMEKLPLAAENDDLLSYARSMQRMLIVFLVEHPNLTRNSVVRASHVNHIDLMVKQIADGIIKCAVRDCERTNRSLPIPVDFLGMYYSSGMMHTLRWWISEGRPISVEELIDFSTVYLEHFFLEN
jgi:AcrR family transcriptional regulator